MRDMLKTFLEQFADLCGYDLMPRDMGSWSDLFWYQFPNITDIAAGATAAPVSVTIQDDSHFLWIASSYHYSLNEAAFTYSTQPIPNMLVTLLDSGSGKQMMNAGVPIDCIFGSPGKPFMLPEPKVLSRNSVITATVQNFDAASATANLMMSLIGRKLYNV